MKKIIPLLVVLLLSSLVLLYFVITSEVKEETPYEKVIVKTDLQSESCINCHGNVQGFTASHLPEKIGCASCHLGNTQTNDKDEAHKGMVLIPGNLSTSKQTCGSCHPGISERVEISLMSSMSGIISVDKYTFDEIDKPSGKYHVKELGNSAADSHLKNLCASCHLGSEKKEFGKITERSRGGGCNACHLNYSTEAENEFKLYSERKKTQPDSALIKFHPSLSLNVTNEHCFGCHSRSGRISTNYEGWHETTLTQDEVKNKNGFRLLQDGRVFRSVDSDVHYKAEMACIDCHTSYEIMGDGASYEHKEEAMRVQCSDCHSDNYETIKLDDFDYESEKIAELRNVNDKKRQFLKVRKSGTPLVNTFIDEDGKAKLTGKISGKTLPLNPPNFICVESKTHKDVSCNSCHSSWAPQCVGCHTEYNPNRKGYDLLNKESTKGSWVEYLGEFFAEAPTLGVVEHKSEEELSKKIEPFIPGMIMTLDKSKYEKNNSKKIFKRLFAPSIPHTIQKESRSCESCHNSSLAIGYGRGKLTYETIYSKGVWKFNPTYEKLEYDNLPQDAWIDFLTDPKKNIGTRENVRPFNLEEQKRILTVGACLTCHKSDSEIMKRSLLDYRNELLNLSEKCILPKWKY
ncbi:MAG: multiheme c-type cytochrome [Melioribacteraceae bacterium]